MSDEAKTASPPEVCLHCPMRSTMTGVVIAVAETIEDMETRSANAWDRQADIANLVGREAARRAAMTKGTGDSTEATEVLLLREWANEMAAAAQATAADARKAAASARRVAAIHRALDAGDSGALAAALADERKEEEGSDD